MAWLVRGGVRAQGTDGVVTGATGTAFEGGGRERPRLVIPAERARAEVTEGRGRGAANAAVVPGTFPTSCRQTDKEFVKENEQWFSPPLSHRIKLGGGHEMNKYWDSRKDILLLDRCAFSDMF